MTRTSDIQRKDDDVHFVLNMHAFVGSFF
jgi:hypothetical protein